jgi:polygalacturonase
MLKLRIITLLIIGAYLNAPGILAQDIQPERPKIPSTILDVQDFGAKGDGETDNTTSIQQAIDKAAEEGGGTVRFSKGNYLSGPFKLKNNIRLQIDKDVVLTMLPLARYPEALKTLKILSEETIYTTSLGEGTMKVKDLIGGRL